MMGIRAYIDHRDIRSLKFTQVCTLMGHNMPGFGTDRATWGSAEWEAYWRFSAEMSVAAVAASGRPGMARLERIKTASEGIRPLFVTALLVSGFALIVNCTVFVTRRGRSTGHNKSLNTDAVHAEFRGLGPRRRRLA